jgi:hypothetical protein
MKRGKARGRQPRKGRGRGREMVKGQVLSKQTPGGDDITRSVAWQLQKERYEADADMEG